MLLLLFFIGWYSQAPSRSLCPPSHGDKGRYAALEKVTLIETLQEAVAVVHGEVLEAKWGCSALRTSEGYENVSHITFTLDVARGYSTLESSGVVTFTVEAPLDYTLSKGEKILLFLKKSQRVGMYQEKGTYLLMGTGGQQQYLSVRAGALPLPPQPDGFLEREALASLWKVK
jgi:ABC-type histidine transport system ATPase subunit